MSDNTFTRLYVGNESDTPDGFDVARSIHEAFFKLELLEYHELIIDLDLSNKYGNEVLRGFHVVLWILDRIRDEKYIPKNVTCVGGLSIQRTAFNKQLNNILNHYG